MEENNQFYLSYSKISTYLKCPLKYKFMYIDNLPTLAKSYFSFGNSIHKALEEFYDPNKNFKDLKKNPYSYLMELLERSWISAGYSTFSDELRAKREAKKILTDFYRKHIFGFKPAYSVEKVFSFELEGFKVEGRIDRIDERNGKFTIIDYKTSSFLPEFFKEDELLQPIIYRIAIDYIIKDIEVEKVVLYFLRHQKMIDFEIDEHLMNKGKQKIIEVGSLIRNGVFYPKLNGYCSSCDFREICSAFSKKEITREV